ncbi:MAG: DUF11 domain-containing protein, partial [Thermoguttaceae bacterium]|nr:DUF11 domain-containing protein [Thermoguttaceae bacterium]
APAAPPAIPAAPQTPAAPPAEIPAPADAAAPQKPVAPGPLPEDPLASYPAATVPQAPQPERNTVANLPGTADTSPRLEYVASLLSKSMPTTSARPGDSTLEGPQTAELSIEKVLPEEVQIGCEETFKVIVRNVGKAIAKNVTLWDQVPTGTTLVATTPAIEPTQEGELIWTGFDLAPEEEQVFEYRLIPQSEGAIGSVASVSFQTEVSGKTSCTRPMLQLHVEAPDQVLVGENLRFEIEISNPGTGTARDVVLREEVPEGLTHKSGRKLDNAIGSIEPGETKHIALTLQAQTAGNITNHMSVSGYGQLSAEADTPVNVQAPELALEIQGARVRYLERETTYTLKVWNPGTAMAKNIRLTAQLPPQMKFVRTNNEGVYQESSHSVYWELIELPNNVAPGDIELVLLPTEIGSGRINFHGEGEMNLAADTSCDVSIEGMAALSYTVASLSDPVEVGQDAVYEIRLSNRGTKDSSNISISVVLPESMEVVAVEGPTSFSANGSAGQFGTLGRIAAKDEAVYRLTTRCAAPGDHRIKVQVASDEMEPLVKEESVRIYGSN